MIIAELIMVLASAFTFGWAGRMDGGATPKTPEWFERFLVMAPIVAFGFACGIGPGITSIAGTVGVATGHGQFFLARLIKAVKPEATDFLIRPFFGEDPRCRKEFVALRGVSHDALSPDQREAIKHVMETYGMRKLYWRCVAGLAITGGLVTLPLALAVLIQHKFLLAAVIVLVGVQKPLGYMLGNYLYTTNRTNWLPEGLKEDTQIGEFLRMANVVFLTYVCFKILISSY